MAEIEISSKISQIQHRNGRISLVPLSRQIFEPPSFVVGTFGALVAVDCHGVTNAVAILSILLILSEKFVLESGRISLGSMGSRSKSSYWSRPIPTFYHEVTQKAREVWNPTLKLGPTVERPLIQKLELEQGLLWISESAEGAVWKAHLRATGIEWKPACLWPGIHCEWERLCTKYERLSRILSTHRKKQLDFGTGKNAADVSFLQSLTFPMKFSRMCRRHSRAKMCFFVLIFEI